MIEKMQKLLFIGLESQKTSFVEKLQEIGVVEITQWKGDLTKKNNGDMTKAERILAAWKTLIKLENENKICTINPANGEETAEQIVESIFRHENEINQLKEKRALIENKLESIRDWGYFDPNLVKEVEKRGNLSIQFWDVQSKVEHLVKIENTIAVVKINHDAMRSYFMTLSGKPIQIKHCLEIRFDQGLAHIEAELRTNLEKEAHLKNELYSYICNKDLVFRFYLEELNKVNFTNAINNSAAPIENMIFAMQGWSPEKDSKKLTEKLAEFPIHIEQIEADPEERIPTYIKNNKFGTLGEDLISIYDTPAYKDWDPSSWVFFSFAIFFAMIFGDGGYAMIMLGLLIYFKKKVKKPKPALKRFFNMSISISAVTLLYGLASGSFFGFAQDNKLFGWLINARLFDSGDIGLMMKVSIIIGMIHICLSLILKGFRSLIDDSDWITPITNIAWIVIIWSFYFWYKFNDNPVTQQSADLSLNIFIGGAAAVFLLAGRTWNPIFAVLKGLLALYNGVQFFSDILSYIRIFALGLSGALIAQSFNGMAEQLWQSGIFGMLFAPVVFLFGHSLNFILCIMGGVVHGLRLNFLEWYRWSFDGGGKNFKPLKNLLTEE